ncbi:hypothetical protein P7K49_007099 [Saguinus oedipus]|uniref:Uncharacterized protein n=1 Tax=Saguinus oedipus TaxID=9490 RepID=A0ABQ9VTX1_SAGOE|nr:hypothetical protein P7K49_007099 [Saguinus oedipus]
MCDYQPVTHIDIRQKQRSLLCQDPRSSSYELQLPLQSALSSPLSFAWKGSRIFFWMARLLRSSSLSSSWIGHLNPDKEGLFLLTQDHPISTPSGLRRPLLHLESLTESKFHAKHFPHQPFQTLGHRGKHLGSQNSRSTCSR